MIKTVSRKVKGLEGLGTIFGLPIGPLRLCAEE
jgi:hypothetical protein